MTDVSKNDNTVYIDRDFELMMVSALRYAIGRYTYVPSTTIDYIQTLLPKLSTDTLQIMKRDIQEEVECFKAMGSELYMEKEWIDLMNNINEAQKLRKVLENEIN